MNALHSWSTTAYREGEHGPVTFYACDDCGLLRRDAVIPARKYSNAERLGEKGLSTLYCRPNSGFVWRSFMPDCKQPRRHVVRVPFKPKAMWRR